MKQPFFSGIPFWLRVRIYFARHRKHVNENLGLIIALLAAGFAGWASWEAHAARNDALASLKIAQRSYINVQEHTVSFANEWQETGARVLQYNHTVTVYGNSPAFQVEEISICRLGMYASHLTLDDLQLRQSFELRLTFSQRLPAEMIPGSRYSSDIGCSYPPTSTDMSVVVYGVINYEDIFGDKHQKHFCYYNISLDSEAVDNNQMVGDDPKSLHPKWSKDQIEAGKHLVACKIFNDEVSGEAATRLNLVNDGKFPFEPLAH